MIDNPFCEEIFPDIPSKLPLVQLETVSSHPLACYLGEETNTHVTTTSFRVVAENEKVSPQPPFLQAKQSQFPQPLLIRLVLWTLHQLCCPSLDKLQHLNVCLVLRGPELNTGLEVRPHQCPVQGHDHIPTPAGHTIPDTSQDAGGLLGHLGTLLAHIQLAVSQHPQVLFCQAAFQPLFPKPVALHGVVVTQVQDLALSLVESHTIGLGPLIQPVQIPLQSLPALKQINAPAQLGVVCKFTEGALDPLIQIIDKGDGRDAVRKAKVQLELKLARDVKNYKKGFFRYVNNKQKEKENVGLLLNRRGEIVSKNAEKAEVLNISFTCVSTSPVGPLALGPKVQVDANTDPPSVKEELVCELLQELDPGRLMGPDDTHLRALRQLADVIEKPLTIIFEKLWRSGNIPEHRKKANIPSTRRA
ncbi:hypothetical protein GRJ2_002910500 [Grus japonensis]|uniref:Uncharacterized protein n=1 Tax=Grus japonensis TaxID=30415 RepID=A0ABC9Y330_GRUJA